MEEVTAQIENRGEQIAVMGPFGRLVAGRPAEYEPSVKHLAWAHLTAIAGSCANTGEAVLLPIGLAEKLVEIVQVG